MSYVNMDKILNESPIKRLIIGYRKLKDDYNIDNAKEYSKLYQDMKLSDILDNSRLIFCEPYFGCKFYKDLMCGGREHCAFSKYKFEIEKVSQFLEENRDKMSPEQLACYEDLKASLVAKYTKIKNTIAVIDRSYHQCQENKEKELSNIEKTLSDDIYDYYRCDNDDEKNNLSQSIRDRMTKLPDYDKNVYNAFAPYVSNVINDPSVAEKITTIIKPDDNEDNASDIIKNSICVSKLYNDASYQEAVNNISNHRIRSIFKTLATESVKDQIDAITTEKVDSIETYYSTPSAAVNHIFDDDYDSIIFKEDYENDKNTRYSLLKEIYESMLDFITYEYQNANDTEEKIQGYNYFEEGTTIEEAFKIINDKRLEVCNELGYQITESDDVSDDDIDNMENDVSNSSNNGKNTTSKKPEAPEPKNLANKVQFKAMDAEVQQQKKMAVAKQKGQEVSNAVKAVKQLPDNVVNDIKNQIHILDDKDDDRRKKYMVEPGFRKKAFRNLKLALLYGGAAKAKLAYIPVVAFCRHFSKKKDRRIRNELLNEIKTELKICDEKINDASAAGDNKEKYQLMRIRSKLEAERLRVRTNSKYI